MSKISSPLENITNISFITVKSFVITDSGKSSSVLIRFEDDYEEEMLFAYSNPIDGSVLFVQSKK